MPRLISFMLGIDVTLMIIGSLIPETQGILPLGGSDLTQFGVLIPASLNLLPSSRDVPAGGVGCYCASSPASI